MTTEERAFAMGYSDAERGKLAQPADLERKCLTAARGDYELADILVDHYMQGFEAYTADMQRLRAFDARNGRR